MNIRNCLLWLFVFLIFCPYVEQKKSRNSNNGNSRKRPRRVKKPSKLDRLCNEQKKAQLPGTALELHAYFDLHPKRKPFACLKISTCGTKPVCFVTTYPYLKNKSINDTTTWLELVTFIQRDRKIEPIYDSPLGWNGDKNKAAHSQYLKNQPAISRMCRGATVYRFVVNENITNTTNLYEDTSVNSTNSSNSSLNPPVPVSSNPAMTLCPLFKRKKAKSMRIKRVGRTKNSTSNNFFLCHGFDCPCMRICVGQGRKNNFTECTTFRIICTFNCGSDTISVPKVPIITKPTTRPTKKSRKRQLKKSRKRPTRRPRRPTRQPRTRPTKNPKKSGRRKRIHQRRKRRRHKNKRTRTPPPNT